jgi:hypothetical protein
MLSIRMVTRMIKVMEMSLCKSELGWALLAFAFLSSEHVLAQTSLQARVAILADEAKGEVSVACAIPSSALNCDLHPHNHSPMQSGLQISSGCDSASFC